MKDFELENEINIEAENENVGEKEQNQIENDIYKNWDELEAYDDNQEEPPFYDLANELVKNDPEYKRIMTEARVNKSNEIAEKYNLNNMDKKVENDKAHALVNHYNSLLKKKGDKEAEEELKKISIEDVNRANDLIREYEDEQNVILMTIKRDSEKAAEEAVEDYKSEWVSDKVSELREEYESEKEKKILARDELEESDNRLWYQFLNAKKKAGADVRRYNQNQRTNYNVELQETVKKIKELSLDSVFTLGIFKKTGPEYPFGQQISEKDVRDAEQMFDTLFMDLNAFYHKNNTGESILDNIVFNGTSKEYRDAEADELKGKNIYDYLKFVLNKCGVNDIENFTKKKMERYAKALFIHALATQSADLQFVPKYFKDVEKAELSPAEDQNDLAFSTFTLVQDAPQNQKVFEETLDHVFVEIDEDVINKLGTYKRLKFEEMQAKFPEYEVPVLDPKTEIKEEPEKLSENAEEQQNKEENKEVPGGEIKEEVPKKDKIEESLNKEIKVEPEKNAKDKEVPVKNEENIEELNDDSIIINPVLTRKEREFNQKVNNYIEQAGKPFNISAVLSFVQGVDDLAKNYSDFGERTQSLTEKITQMQKTYAMNQSSFTRKNLPAGTTFEYTNNPDIIKILAETYVTANDLLEDFKKYNDKNRGPYSDVNSVIIDIIESHDALVSSDDYEDILKIDPTYNYSYKAAFTTFPYNSFKQKNGKFEPDNKAYVEMMNFIPFLKVIKDRQTYFREHYIDTQMARKGGKLSDNNIRDYKKYFVRNLERTRENYNKLRAVDSKKDPYITSLQPFEHEPGFNFGENWQKGRHGAYVMRDVNRQLSAVDRGWPVEDTGLILEMYRVELSLRNIAEGGGNANAQQQRRAKEILERISEPLNKVKNGIVTSVEMRDDIVDSLQTPINDYVELMEGFPINIGKAQVPYGTPAIKDIYEAARLREVKPVEMEIKEHRMDEVNLDYTPGLSFDMIKENIDIMMKELNAVEMAIKGSDEFKEMKISLQQLQTYAHEQMGHLQEGVDHNVAYANSLTELKERLLDTTQKTKKYLTHKQVQFDKDGNRREAGKRQKREQPRIHMSINQLDKLNFMVDMIDGYENKRGAKYDYMHGQLKHDVEAATNRMVEKLNGCAEVMQNKNVSKNNYLLSLGRVLMYTKIEDTSTFKPQEDEKFEDFKARINGLGTRDISKAEIEAMMKKDPIFREIMQTEKDSFNNPKHRRLNVKDAHDLYNNKKARIEKEQGLAKDERTIKEKNKDKVKSYKSSLISNRSRNQRNTKKTEKANQRQEMENKKGFHI